MFYEHYNIVHDSFNDFHEARNIIYGAEKTSITMKTYFASRASLLRKTSRVNLEAAAMTVETSSIDV